MTIEDNSFINDTGTIMVNFFLKKELLENDIALTKLEIIFPEDRIADVVKIKPFLKIRFWNGQKLFLDDFLDKLSTTHRVGSYQILFPSEVCGRGEQLWLSFSFSVAPAISKLLPVLVRAS